MEIYIMRWKAVQTILKGVLFYLISVFDSPKNCSFLPKTNKVLADVQTNPTCFGADIF